ncbi:MAG TPA: hypothetical protein VLG37_02575 [Candidatus Saccharimonadales bacterium]|nr:hypothetical protein [Candidatus Saccharimonadales bacterium]
MANGIEFCPAKICKKSAAFAETGTEPTSIRVEPRNIRCPRSWLSSQNTVVLFLDENGVTQARMVVSAEAADAPGRVKEAITGCQGPYDNMCGAEAILNEGYGKPKDTEFN